MTGGLGAPGAVVFRRAGGVDEIDAIDEHSRRLVDALGAIGVEARYLPDGLSSISRAKDAPRWVLLQYNPFRYGRAGFAPSLLEDAFRLRRRWRTSLAVMVHEAWVDITDWRSTMIGLWGRAQLRSLLRLTDVVMTSTEGLAREIGGEAIHVPVATNITPLRITSEDARQRLGLDGRLAVTLFGRGHPSRALAHAEAAIAALAEAHGPDRLIVLNLGADAPALRVPAGIEVSTPGRLRADDVSVRMSASDLVLLPFVDGVSTRRSTLMAALAHGRPVLGLEGHNTDRVLSEARDSLVLTPATDTVAFARAAVELARDQPRLRAVGDAGRRLYESQFDWPVLARRVAAALEELGSATNGSRPALRARASRRREVVFVANDVGGSGGMERQSEQLVGRLLDAGQPVTVIARTCAMQKRDGLRFVRVPTPRRPFSVAYPAFFAVASLLAARRGDALLHTTGAIVANRVDVSTVHYCHRAARGRVHGSRVSRPGPLYRINAAIAVILSVAGEAWCYRPGRAHTLCAVSGGVRDELVARFPAMSAAVRTVPNGVDAAVFKPDAVARREVRTDLGLDHHTALAVFVGGDWERKGLIYAVDALAYAPGWHLAVAGAGDPAPLAARALAAGTRSRLHLLGPVSDTPRLYAAGDAFVLPTAYEAFPLVILEAAASELPLLVTRVNGAEELLEEGCNGWFITRDGEDIARRLNELRSDPDVAREMAAGSRAAVAGYSWQTMADGYLSLYAELRAS